MKSFRPKDGDDTPPGPGRNGEREAASAMLDAIPRGKRVEKVFVWIEAADSLRKIRHKGKAQVFTLIAAYNLVKLPKLMVADRIRNLPKTAGTRKNGRINGPDPLFKAAMRPNPRGCGAEKSRFSAPCSLGFPVATD